MEGLVVSFPVEKRVTDLERPFLFYVQPNLQLDDSTVKRNRNLFGSLLGHLKKAKNVLDQEKTTKAVGPLYLHFNFYFRPNCIALWKSKLARNSIWKEGILQSFAEEISRWSWMCHWFKLLPFIGTAEKRRSPYSSSADRTWNERKRNACKNSSIIPYLCWQSVNLQRHFKRMKSFIRTEYVMTGWLICSLSTCPMIFWVPGVHNDKTKELQVETSAQIEVLTDTF